MSTATNTFLKASVDGLHNALFKIIAELFENNALFDFLIHADNSSIKHHALPNKTNDNIVGYLTPVHPFLIHVVEHNESKYLESLTTSQITQLLKKLIQHQSTHIVFAHKANIPNTFLKQKKINILRACEKISPYHYLFNATQHIPLAQTSIHGSVAVLFNQGIIITGESGTGKSSLLLSLIDRGHLWIADDSPHIYLNQHKEIYAAFNDSISTAKTKDNNTPSIAAFIHTRNTGVINVDHTFGKTKRIPRHKLAAIIHLSDNAQINAKDNVGLSGYKMINILGQALPQWTIVAHQDNLVIFVESIAKQLILNSWGDNASEALINTHHAIINTSHKNET